jgi:hypothetical protein
MVDLTSMVSVWGERAGLSVLEGFRKSAEGGAGGFLTSMFPRPAPYMMNSPQEFPVDVQVGRVLHAIKDVLNEVQKFVAHSGSTSCSIRFPMRFFKFILMARSTFTPQDLAQIVF